MNERSFNRALAYLGVCGCILCAGSVALALLGREIPDAIKIILGGIVGTIGGIVQQPQRAASSPATAHPPVDQSGGHVVRGGGL